MRIKKHLSVLLSFCIVACSVNTGRGLAGGDSEPIHGGDPYDLVIRSTRNKTVITLNEIKMGDLRSELAAKPISCAGYVAPQLCDALDLSENQKAKVRDFLIRNVDALISLIAGERPTPIIVTTESKTFLSPDGIPREVMAWVAEDSYKNKIIKMNSKVRDLATPELIALFFHEFLHLITDSELGHVLTDNEVVPGFESIDGSGRRFADTAGAAMALLIYPPAMPANPGASPSPSPTPSPTSAPYALGAPTTASQFSLGGTSILDGQVQFADVTGDGRKDAIYISRSNVVFVSAAGPTSYGVPVQWGRHGGSFKKGQFQFADVSGDGKADMLFQNDNNLVELALSTGTSFGNVVSTKQLSGTFIAGQVQFYDINGDAKVDMIQQTDTNEINGFVSAGTSFNNGSQWMKHGPYYYQYTANYADVTGDGSVDLIFQQATANYFHWSTSQNTQFTTSHLSASFSGDWTLGRTLLSDMDGDKKADLIYIDVNKVIWVALSTGTTFAKPQPVSLLEGAYVPGRLKADDVDGDGKSDLLYQRDDNTYEVAISLGGKVKDFETMAQTIETPVNAGAFAFVKPATGNRKPLVYVDGAGKIWLVPVK